MTDSSLENRPILAHGRFQKTGLDVNLSVKSWELILLVPKRIYNPSSPRFQADYSHLRLIKNPSNRVQCFSSSVGIFVGALALPFLAGSLR